RRAGLKSMSQLRALAARRSMSSNKPLPGPTYQRPSASTITGGRVPPTPGSTTHRNVVPAGRQLAAVDAGPMTKPTRAIVIEQASPCGIKGEPSDGDLYRACKLHRARDPKRQG